MKEKKYLDIIQAYLSLKKKNLFSRNWRGKFLRRKLILQLLLNGELSLEEALLGILPGRFRTRIKKFIPHNSDFSIPFLKRFFGEDYYFNPVYFLGYKLYYLPLEETNERQINKYLYDLLELIEQIVIQDQYCAREFIKNNSIIIDAGANIGVFSLFALHLSPDSKIYAFEPTTKIFNIFQKTIAENNLFNHIHLFNIALGDEDKKVMLMKSQEGLEVGNIIADSNALIKERFFVGSEEISMMTLDKFVQKNNIKKVDFIKIDTEGYEKQIIAGAKEVIKEFSPVIACSAYHLKNDEIEIPKLVLSINKKYNYRLENRAEKDLIFWPKK